MTDQVIEAINNGTLTAENLTHGTLRESYRRQIYEDGPQALGRGRSILDNTKDLDQYLHSYGKMVNQQWEKAYRFNMVDDDTTIIDYGCGQGLSFLNLVCRWTHDGENETWQDYLKSIVLIEPSGVALNRAEAIAQLKFPDVNIRTINKNLEDLDNNDLSFDSNNVMIHIFSQVLDMPLADGFDVIDFFETITATAGTHYIHIISHDIETEDSSSKILRLYKHIVSNYVDNDPYFSEEPSKYTDNVALNTFEIVGTRKNYDCIAMFACIKTYVGD